MVQILQPENNLVVLSNRVEKHSVVFLDKSKLTIAGKVSETTYERTFKLGDLVEYDSDFNGSLIGRLKRIYKDRILVVDKDQIHRISLYTFARRNWNNEEVKNATV